MDDDEYQRLRNQLDPGDGYSFVLETIIAEADGTASEDAIRERFDQLNNQLEASDSSFRYDVDACIETLEDEDMITADGDSYSLTDHGEAFLREDLEDFDRYRESLQFSTAFNEARDLATGLQTYDTAEYDPEDYDIDEIEAYFLEEDNLDILTSFLEHPYETPSLTELAFMTGREEESVSEELDTMDAYGLIDEHDGGDGVAFYRLTDEAWTMLGEETGLFGPDPEQTAATWKAIYGMVEKPAEIEALEQRPRPE